jgi:hypothetical protein
MTALAKFAFRRTLFVGLGGAGNQALIVFRAWVIVLLGWLPECWRFLGIDFATDPPAAPDYLFPAVPAAVWRAAALPPADVRLLSLPPDCAALAERIKRGDADVAWIGRLVPPEILAGYGGGEASRIPAFSRLALALSVGDDGVTTGKSWLTLLAGKLEDLAPLGRAAHAMMMAHGISMAEDATPPLMVAVAGTEGGTGNGALLPVAIAARSIAGAAARPVHIEAALLTGHYRPADGQEESKGAVAHALDLDLEYAMSAGRGLLALPTGSEAEIATAEVPFDGIYRMDAAGRLRHDYRAALAQFAELLLFRYASATGAKLQKSSNNVLFRPKLQFLNRRDSRPMEESHA